MFCMVLAKCHAFLVSKCHKNNNVVPLNDIIDYRLLKNVAAIIFSDYKNAFHSTLWIFKQNLIKSFKTSI